MEELIGAPLILLRNKFGKLKKPSESKDVQVFYMI